MRATLMYEAGDVRIENVPDAQLIEPTDALITVTRACICGSDLWPYKTMEHDDTGRRMGHEAVGVVATKGCTPRASTEGSSAPLKSPELRPKRFVCPKRTERSSSCRSARTTR
jgi:threonine dehydrogenase-like Zn-dependent dehydrogenase